jgi:hypothetical protein
MNGTGVISVLAVDDVKPPGPRLESREAAAGLPSGPLGKPATNETRVSPVVPVEAAADAAGGMGPVVGVESPVPREFASKS